MFRELIPALDDRMHLVVPDFPAFGQSDMPARSTFTYTFETIANIIARFTEVIRLKPFTMYVFDYGAPVGFRLAANHPDRVTAIVSQNGNAYEEGLSDGWNPIRTYWEHPSPDNRNARRKMLAPETTRWQYVHGVPDETSVSPDGYSLDNFYLARPGWALRARDSREGDRGTDARFHSRRLEHRCASARPLRSNVEQHKALNVYDSGVRSDVSAEVVMHMRRLAVVAMFVGAAMGGTHTLAAQTSTSVVVVRVTDSAGNAVARADASLFTRLAQRVAGGATDQHGLWCSPRSLRGATGLSCARLDMRRSTVPSSHRQATLSRCKSFSRG